MHGHDETGPSGPRLIYRGRCASWSREYVPRRCAMQRTNLKYSPHINYPVLIVFTDTTGAPMAEISKPIDGVVDHRGLPIFSRSAAGGWTSGAFIIWTVVLEGFASFSISFNLISYLTGPLGESTAVAAVNVNAWSGVSMILPLLGGFIGDSFGRYRTVIFSSILYVLGLGMLASSAVGKETWLPAQFRTAFFFLALYLVALAQGGRRPCVQAFGADQFDGNDPEECRSRSSFFNWLGFAACGGAALTGLLMSYIQDNIGWGLGFGLPCIAMVISSALFMAGTRTYRFCRNYPKIQPASQQEQREPLLTSPSSEFSWRGLLRLMPIWATCSLYSVVVAQSSTFFTKQGSTVDRRIFSSFLVPAAALQSFINISVLVSLPLYDRVFVPLARSFTGHPSGLTMLQRIGIGMFLSVSATITAALVEKKRLQTAREFGLADRPDSAIPMSLWWFLPQYIIIGISNVFTMVGLQEFFYDQAPKGMRGLGIALSTSIVGMGSFVSGFLVLVLQNVSAWCGEDWFSDNLNQAHLDYFYWFLASLAFIDFLLYLYVASAYRYKVKERG